MGEQKVTLVHVRRGDVGRCAFRGKTIEVPIVETVPQYHKFAICRIEQNERVCKYGEVIGRAIRPVAAGAHVHEHNLISPGENQS